MSRYLESDHTHHVHQLCPCDHVIVVVVVRGEDTPVGASGREGHLSTGKRTARCAQG
jgi:hypothetical protein